MDPNFDLAHFYLGMAEILQGDRAEAITELQKVVALRNWPDLMSYLAYALAASGRRDEAEKVLDELSHRPYVPMDLIAMIYVGLGDKDRALACLAKAYEDRAAHLVFLKVEHLWDPLRSDPRFIALMKKLNFP